MQNFDLWGSQMKFSLNALYNGYRHFIRNPQTRWWVVLGTIVYLFSPLDISPDIFPFAGQIDDFLLITLLISELFQISLTGSDEQWQAEQDAARSAPESSTPAPDSEQTIDVKAVSLDD